MSLILRTPKQGAQPILHALLADEIRAKSGIYVDSDLIIKNPSDLAQNDQLALRLWLTSEKWTRLGEMRKIFDERLKTSQWCKIFHSF